MIWVKAASYALGNVIIDSARSAARWPRWGERRRELVLLHAELKCSRKIVVSAHMR